MRWRADLDALEFSPPGHGAPCLMHRLAFRALLGRDPAPAQCLAYFEARSAAFLAASTRKIAARALARSCSLHLTSRDIKRQLTA